MRKAWHVTHTTTGTHPLRIVESRDEFVAIGTPEQLTALLGEAVAAPGFGELIVRPMGRESSAIVDLDKNGGGLPA